MYEKGKGDSIPKRERKQESRFESTKEWQMMRADIDAGIAPGAWLHVALTDEELENLELTTGTQGRRTIMRFIQKYISGLDIKHPLTVKSFQKDGKHHLYVIHPKKTR